MEDLVFLVESNADLSNHVKTLSEAMQLVEGDLDFMKGDTKELYYTITPKSMTAEEWETLDTE